MNFPSKYNYQCLKSKCQTHNDQPEAVQSNDPSPARNERLKIHYCQKPISPIRVFDPMRPIKRNKAKSNKIKHSQWVHQWTKPYDLLNYTNTTTFYKITVLLMQNVRRLVTQDRHEIITTVYNPISLRMWIIGLCSNLFWF